MSAVHPGTRKKDEAAKLEQVCSVRVGDVLYGVPITHILEIVGGAKPQVVPLAPGFVGGLMHYRGDVLTAVSLRRLLGLAEREGKQDLLVVEAQAGCFGLLVDSVEQVMTVSSEDYERNPSTVEERRKALFAGAYKLKDGLMVMLDPERLEPMHLAKAG